MHVVPARWCHLCTTVQRTLYPSNTQTLCPLPPHLMSSALRLRLSRALASVWRTVHDLSCLNWTPFVSLGPDAECEKCRTNHKRLQTHLLSLVHLWLCRPIQKFYNILCHLACCGRCAIFVLDKSIIKHACHCNTSTWEVWVEVESRLYRCACRGFLRVPCQQIENVVASTVPGLDDQ